MIEQAARHYVKQAMSDGEKPSFYASEKALRRGIIWQVMEECRYNQAEAAKALGINRGTLRTYINQFFTKSEMTDMGIKQ